jgi:hypothetical protein
MSEGRVGIIIDFPVFAETGPCRNPHNWRLVLDVHLLPARAKPASRPGGHPQGQK